MTAPPRVRRPQRQARTHALAHNAVRTAAAPGVRRQRLWGLLASLVLVASSAAWVAATLGPLHKPKQVHESDHHHYVEMARGFARPPGAPGPRPELALRAPYCWRVFVPGLVALLMRVGVNLHVAFYALTNAALLAFLYVLFVSLEDLGFDLRLRLVGLGLVGLMQGAVRWFEVQYWMTDPAGLLCVALGVLLARRLGDTPPGASRQGLLLRLAALLLLAACVRETWVLVVPFAFFTLLRHHGVAHALVTSAALAAPACAATWLLRRFIVPAVHPGLLDSIVDNVGFRLNHAGDNQLYVLTLGTWGVLLPLALLAPGGWLARARAGLPELSLTAFVYVTTVLISNNNDRPLAYALPALLPAALAGLRRLVDAAPARAWAPIVAVLALQALFFALTRFTGLGISVYQPVSWPVVVSLVGAGLLALRLLRPHATPQSPGGAVGSR